MTTLWQQVLQDLPHPSNQLVDDARNSVVRGSRKHLILTALQAAIQDPASTALIKRALDQDQGDSRLRATLLHAQAQNAAGLNDVPFARRILTQLETLIQEDMSPRFHLLAPRLRFQIGLITHDLDLQTIALQHAQVLLAQHPDPDAELEFRVQALRHHIEAGRFPIVYDQLEKLQTVQDVLISRIGINIDSMRRWALEKSCDFIAAKNYLQTHKEKDFDALTKIRFALITGNYQYCQDLLDEAQQHRENEQWGVVDRSIFCAAHLELALLRHDAPALRTALHRIACDKPIERSQYTQTLAIQAALSQGKADHARFILRRCCPSASAPCHLVEWCRLHLLEGNSLAAQECFSQALREGGNNFVAWRLGLAWELTAGTTAQLWAGIAHHEDLGLTTPKPTTQAKDQPNAAPNQWDLIGTSPGMTQARELIEHFAGRTQAALLVGETGTGKEICARLLHQLSPNPDLPFICVNCSGMSESLAESELFGHRKGSFTGADYDRPGAFRQAEQGTLFLDEVADLPPRIQGLLLRVLEVGDYQAIGANAPRIFHGRIIAASNRPLSELVEQGLFRSDLRYRLERMIITIPPLRDRVGDIPLLAQHFIDASGLRPAPQLAPALIADWQRRPWPGNVRELRNEVERLLVFYNGTGLLGELHQNGTQTAATSIPPSTSPAPETRTQRPVMPPPPVSSQIQGGGAALQRRDQALHYLAEQGWLTRKTLAEHLHCAPATARRTLLDLESEGLIQRILTGGNLRTSYYIATPPPNQQSDHASAITS